MIVRCINSLIIFREVLIIIRPSQRQNFLRFISNISRWLQLFCYILRCSTKGWSCRDYFWGALFRKHRCFTNWLLVDRVRIGVGYDYSFNCFCKLRIYGRFRNHIFVTFPLWGRKMLDSFLEGLHIIALFSSN